MLIIDIIIIKTLKVIKRARSKITLSLEIKLIRINIYFILRKVTK